MVAEEDELDIGGDREDALVIGQAPELPAGSMLVLSTEQTISTKECLPEALHLSRKEKRKRLKKLRRKQVRQQAAENEKLEENARLDDSAEQLRIQLEGQIESERLAAEKANHDEQERLWLEREKKAMEDFQRQQEEIRKLEEDKKLDDVEDDSGYVDDDGPAEIIWKGNEIIVRKRRVKSVAEPPASAALKDANKSTSNPLPPQCTAFAARSKYPQNPDVSEQNPMFGTEQDKTHCPFHFKTGVCRFGVRCSRVHVYPDQSFTLLMRNMYTGPGLTWENDEGLEHSDEEVAQHFEEFYEDVHSEFLQFGELVNFKVCKNGSSHLRGNVYVHYKTEAGAQAAYSAMNGRYYAGKQITCEFVGVTRWRVALCGEYMKGHHRPCSHGTACNFLHCFRNPQGEYDWADWDGAPPRYWATKMAKLFGYENDQEDDDDEFKDEIRRHGGSAGSPRQREPQRKESRSSYRHHHSTRDDFEYAARHRERRRRENRGDCYHSDYEEPERSSRGRDAHHLSSSKDVDERFRGNGKDTIQGFHSIADEAVAHDSHELKGDKRQKLERHKKTGSCDVDEEIHGRRRRQNRSGSHNHSVKNTYKDGERNIKRHRSRDLKDSDKRQSLDLRSSRGRHRSRYSETENPIGLETEYAARKYYSKEADISPVHRRTGNIKSRESFEDRGSSESDVNRGHKRRRNYSHKLGGAEGSIRRKSRNLEIGNEMEEEKSLVINDRWTGDTDS